MYYLLFFLLSLFLADSNDPRYAEVRSASLPDVEDDDSDPNYARINNFRPPPSPQSYISRTPSPATAKRVTNQLQTSTEELDGLYAKVNKSRPPPAERWDSRGREKVLIIYVSLVWTQLLLI